MESKKEIGQRGQQFFWQVHGQTSLTASHDITSFVGQRRDVMRWPPAVVSETEAQDPLEQGLTHTHTHPTPAHPFEKLPPRPGTSVHQAQSTDDVCPELANCPAFWHSPSTFC